MLNCETKGWGKCAQKRFGILVAGFVLTATPALAQSAFNIDFRNGEWELGGTTARGWRNDPATNLPFTTGRATYANGLVLTVTDSFVGTASAGLQNFTLDPPQQRGFTFQNNGSGDFNRGSTLDNFHRIDFAFSRPITLDRLQLEDIDTQNTTGANGWRDATTIQLWRDAPTPFGSGITPNIGLNSTTNLTVLSAGDSPFGVPYVFATTRGNTTNNDPRSIANFASTEVVDGFSVFLWNQRDGNAGGNHGISLLADGNSFTAVPEPTSHVLIAIASAGGLLRRKRTR